MRKIPRGWWLPMTLSVAAFSAGWSGPGADPSQPAASPTRSRLDAQDGEIRASDTAEELPAILSRIRRAGVDDLETLRAPESWKSLSPVTRQAVLLRLAEIDPRLLMTWLAEGLEVVDSDKWLSWMGREHRELLTEFAANGNLPVRFRTHCARSLLDPAASDPETLLEQSLSNLKDGTMSDDPSGAMDRLAREDPAAALDFLTRLLEAGETRDIASRNALARMADLDPEGLSKAFAIATDPGLRESMAMALGRSLARADPDRARGFVDSLPASPVRRGAGLEVADVLRVREPGETLDWIAERWPEGMFRWEISARVYAGMIDGDPERVARGMAPSFDVSTLDDYRSSNPDNAKHPRQVIGRALEAWGRENPDEAMNFIDVEISKPREGEEGAGYLRAWLEALKKTIITRTGA